MGNKTEKELLAECIDILLDYSDPDMYMLMDYDETWSVNYADKEAWTYLFDHDTAQFSIPVHTLADSILKRLNLLTKDGRNKYKNG